MRSPRNGVLQEKKCTLNTLDYICKSIKVGPWKLATTKMRKILICNLELVTDNFDLD